MNIIQQNLRKCGSLEALMRRQRRSSNYRRCMTTIRESDAAAKGQKTRWVRPEVVPLVAMVSLALGLGVVSMYREMVLSPSVVVSKAKRMNMYEVDDPERAESLGHVFIDQSPLRKLIETSPPRS